MPHLIKNFAALAASALRTDALSIAEAGFAAIDTGECLRRKVSIRNDELRVGARAYPLSGRRMYFVGAGKSAFPAAAAIEGIFGDRLAGGMALGVGSAEPQTSGRVEMIVGTHPLPSETNEAATGRITRFLSERTEEDLVLMHISGGGSTLLCQPDVPGTCVGERVLFEMLTRKGGSIQEINTG